MTNCRLYPRLALVPVANPSAANLAGKQRRRFDGSGGVNAEYSN